MEQPKDIMHNDTARRSLGLLLKRVGPVIDEVGPEGAAAIIQERAAVRREIMQHQAAIRVHQAAIRKLRTKKTPLTLIRGGGAFPANADQPVGLTERQRNITTPTPFRQNKKPVFSQIITGRRLDQFSPAWDFD